MEPLLKQADRFNASQSSSSGNTVGDHHHSKFPHSLTRHQAKNLQNDLPDFTLQTSFSTPSSSSSGSGCTSSENIVPSIRTNPPLTSSDIAALRKSLSGRPKLRRLCHICGRECPSRHKLQRHLSTHSEERPYNCKVCGKAFKWTEYLSKHMRTQHGSNGSSSSTSGCSQVIKTYTTSRNTGSTGSISSNEDVTAAPTNSSNGTAIVRANTNAGNVSRANRCSSPPVNDIFVTSPSNAAVLNENTTSQQPERRNTASTSSTSGFSDNNQSQSTPDVFSPQSTYDRNLLTESVPSSTLLLSNQLTPSYNGGYFPSNFPYPPLFPMNCYGYPSMESQMSQYLISQQFNNTSNMFSSFDGNYQNYLQPQAMNTQHKVQPPPVSVAAHVFNDPKGSPSPMSSSSVSCQTQEPQDNEIVTTAKSRPPVVIINLSTKKDVGIQCEVGDETLQALFEEEQQAIANGFDSNSSMDTSDEGPSNICKYMYPCEHDNCSRSYVHRKDLVRHMKAAHGGALPKLLQPRIIEAPAKPFVCQVAECGKSYYHLKDLRRHQRQCHLAGIASPPEPPSLVRTETAAAIEESNGSNLLRYPCDFSDCSKSYVHKKDLIRHKKMYHQDGAMQLPIPDPMCVVHVKKGQPDNGDKSYEEDDESTGEVRIVKRFRLDSSAEPLNGAQLPIGNDQPLMTVRDGDASDLTCLSASNIMDDISAAVANIFDMDGRSSNLFTNVMPSSSGANMSAEDSNGMNSATNLVLSGDGTAAMDSTATAVAAAPCSNVYTTPVSSPSAVFMTLLSQNI